MGVGHSNQAYSFSDHYYVIEDNFPLDNYYRLQSKFTDQLFIGRQINSLDKEDSYEIQCIINQKLTNPSPFVTKLLNAQKSSEMSNCSLHSKFYLLYREVGKLLSQQIQQRRFRNIPFSIEEILAVIIRVSKGLKYLYDIGHNHGNVTAYSITWPRFSNQAIELIDQWALKDGNRGLRLTRNIQSQKIQQKGMMQSNDLYNLGNIAQQMLQVAPNNRQLNQSQKQLYNNLKQKIFVLRSQNPGDRLQLYGEFGRRERQLQKITIMHQNPPVNSRVYNQSGAYSQQVGVFPLGNQLLPLKQAIPQPNIIQQPFQQSITQKVSQFSNQHNNLQTQPLVSQNQAPMHSIQLPSNPIVQSVAQPPMPQISRNRQSSQNFIINSNSNFRPPPQHNIVKNFINRSQITQNNNINIAPSIPKFNQNNLKIGNGPSNISMGVNNQNNLVNQSTYTLKNPSESTLNNNTSVSKNQTQNFNKPVVSFNKSINNSGTTNTIGVQSSKFQIGPVSTKAYTSPLVNFNSNLNNGMGTANLASTKSTVNIKFNIKPTEFSNDNRMNHDSYFLRPTNKQLFPVSSASSIGINFNLTPLSSTPLSPIMVGQNTNQLSYLNVNNQSTSNLIPASTLPQVSTPLLTIPPLTTTNSTLSGIAVPSASNIPPFSMNPTSLDTLTYSSMENNYGFPNFSPTFGSPGSVNHNSSLFSFNDSSSGNNGRINTNTINTNVADDSSLFTSAQFFKKINSKQVKTYSIDQSYKNTITPSYNTKSLNQVVFTGLSLPMMPSIQAVGSNQTKVNDIDNNTNTTNTLANTSGSNNINNINIQDYSKFNRQIQSQIKKITAEMNQDASKTDNILNVNTQINGIRQQNLQTTEQYNLMQNGQNYLQTLQFPQQFQKLPQLINEQKNNKDQAQITQIANNEYNAQVFSSKYTSGTNTWDNSFNYSRFNQNPTSIPSQTQPKSPKSPHTQLIINEKQSQSNLNRIFHKYADQYEQQSNQQNFINNTNQNNFYSTKYQDIKYAKKDEEENNYLGNYHVNTSIDVRQGDNEREQGRLGITENRIHKEYQYLKLQPQQLRIVRQAYPIQQIQSITDHNNSSPQLDDQKQQAQQQQQNPIDININTSNNGNKNNIRPMQGVTVIPELSEQSGAEDEERQYVVEEYENGSRYEGEKLNGMRDGRGKFYYREGSYYDGCWKKNNMHGFGKLYYPNHNIAYEGDWFIDQFHGYGKVFNDEPTLIDGTFDYTNFDMLDQKWKYYQGTLVCDSKEGFGKLALSNEEYYEGNFQGDRVHGQGKFVTCTGEIIHGIWEQSKLIKVL